MAKKKKAPQVYATHITAPNGQRVYVRGKAKEEFDKKVAQLRRDVQSGVDIACETTFREYAAIWLEVYKKGSVRPTTYSLHEMMLRLHVLPFLGDTRLRDVRSMHIQQYLNILAASGLSHSSKEKCLRGSAA